MMKYRSKEEWLAEGRRQERAQVVAWLKIHPGWYAQRYAKWISRGNHYNLEYVVEHVTRQPRSVYKMLQQLAAKEKL